jgi:hypothetical protein
MRPGRIITIVLGAFAALLGVGMLLAGAGILVATAVARDDAGYFDTTTERLSTGTYALTSEEIDLGARPGPGDWTPKRWATVRLRVESSTGQDVFVGVAPQAEVAAYLDGVPHAVVDDVDFDPFRVRYDVIAGNRAPAEPGGQGWWVASASGAGRVELTWDVEPGRWAIVVMNADASRGVDVEASIGVRVPALAWIGLGLLLAALLVLPLAIVAIVWGASGARPAAVAGALPPPVGVPTAPPEAGAAPYPVRLTGHLDEPLSRWLWLVKWLLVIPHVIVLVVLWVGFVVATLVAGFAILFTGRYPAPLFRYTSGVLRWTWRVQFYASGALGTDRYPPFTLGPADYPAELEIDPPERLSRGLWLVKWLLALPHLIVVGLLGGGLGTGVVGGWSDDDGVRWGGGLLGILVLVAGVVLLFTGRYPKDLFAFVMGCNRWITRVVAYVALMTDRYPPFRLDLGGDEPGAGSAPEPLPPPAPDVVTWPPA